MLTFEQAQEALTAIADALPAAIYKKLNGGIIVLPEEKQHEQAVSGDLFVLGEYRCEPNSFGRYIVIYYGSLHRTYGHLSDALFCKKLEEVLHHELVHHLENLAGDTSLELKDAIEMEQYRRAHQKKAEN